MDAVWLSNPTNKRLALKVKCTNNLLYRVEPIYALVNPHNQQQFEVLRIEGGDSKTDRLIFIYSAVSFFNRKWPRV